MKDWPTFPRSFLTASAMSLRLSEMKRSRLFSWWILNSRGLVLPVWKDFLARCTTSCSRDILNKIKNTHQVQGPNVTQLIELTKVNSTQSYWMLQLELTVCQREGHRIQEHETELRTFTHIAQISATNKHFLDHWRNTVRRQLHTMLQRCITMKFFWVTLTPNPVF